MPVGIEARVARQRELVSLARRFLVEARRALGPLTAWVYGPVVRGDFNLWSDVDVLVVAKGLPQRPQDRFGMLLELAPGVEPKATRRRSLEASLGERGKDEGPVAG